MNRSGRMLMNWNRSFTQARSPKPPALRMPWSGPTAAAGARAARSAQIAVAAPPTAYPAAKPTTVPVDPPMTAPIGQRTRTAKGADTVSSAYCSKCSRARGTAGTIHHARANGNAAIRLAAIAGLKSLIAEWRRSP